MSSRKPVCRGAMLNPGGCAPNLIASNFWPSIHSSYRAFSSPRNFDCWKWQKHSTPADFQAPTIQRFNPPKCTRNNWCPGWSFFIDAFFSYLNSTFSIQLFRNLPCRGDFTWSLSAAGCWRVFLSSSNSARDSATEKKSSFEFCVLQTRTNLCKVQGTFVSELANSADVSFD